jgi:hypothetical protein
VGVLAVAALAGCGSDDGASAGDPAGSPPDRPGETWYRVTLCSSVGPASVVMPGPASIDGPRPLANLAGPAEGTFAVSYGSTDDRRYDAFVIDDVGHLGPDAAEMAERVLLPLNGEPEVVDLDEPTTVDDHVEVPYVETFNDRKMHSHALAGRGVLYAFSVGVRQGSAAKDLDLALDDLGRMRTSASFPGLDGGDEAGPCRPTQEPIAGGDEPDDPDDRRDDRS